jgi:hypothetical protein
MSRVRMAPAGATRIAPQASPAVPSFNPNGTVMDLAKPEPRDIDFGDMAATLAKIARFNGIHRGPAYSVAQHCVLGAEALDFETGDKVLAGYFLLHDGHEYRFGDWPSPSVDAIAHRLTVLTCDASAARLLREAIADQKLALDLAIWRAAGLRPITAMPEYARAVHGMDARMLRFEALALFGPKAAAHLPAADCPVPRVTVSLAKPWPAEVAREKFLDRLERYLGIVARPA